MKIYLIGLVVLIAGALIGALSTYLYIYEESNEAVVDLMVLTHVQDSKRILVLFDGLEKQDYEQVKYNLENMLVYKNATLKGCIHDEDFCSEYAGEYEIKSIKNAIEKNEAWLAKNSFLINDKNDS